ncbi:MAG: hypothetical protein NVS4B13_08100 [Candidatus Elarobacter sp.]
MSGHDIAELLPFYANGTLDAADHARVEAELAICAACAGELRDLEGLAASLQARAGDGPPLPAHVLDDALVRIAPQPPMAVTKLRTAWWGTPARYATAAAFVVGVGAAGTAAWHVREADIERATQGTLATAHDRTTTVFRITPGPKAPPQSLQHATESAPTVAKQHLLAKKARIELLVRDVESTLKGAQSTVRSAGGEVTSFADAGPRTTDAVHTATVEVEVPADRLDASLDRLATLGTVQNRAIDAEDVDATIVDEEARLRNLRRAEDNLRKLMDKGGKVDEILSVQHNLSEVRGSIEQLDAQHRHDVHRIATSTITVTLTEDRPNPAPAKPGPTARIDGAWHSGLNALADTLVDVLSAIVWCVAYAPIPLALGAMAFAATRLRKRRAAPV